ncbi:regulatory protein [Ruminococcus sp. YRD2003]|uniref:regulatory protein RecX n=1 Tax=Ruminococcus sp. YRD2003 TaxID=1452313 RepID=UPI0008C3FEAD|nr:RecX family transcriptional regulator [Ruminococcus sp.]SEK47079.1 regulatory protein [Ruminococcus flavefaciens]
MEITSISRYKGSTFEVELDGERKLYLHIDIIADNGLKKGSQLDKTELRKIIYDSNFRRAYQYALYCLDYRDYSERDMLRKLIGTYKNEDLCRAVVGKLAGAGVIDDARYAEKLARRLVEGRRYGFRRAKKELLLKGIGEDTAAEALEQYGDTFGDNLAELLRTKHYRLLTDSSDRKNIEKVKSALVRYGYGFDEINAAVREYFEDAEQAEE